MISCLLLTSESVVVVVFFNRGFLFGLVCCFVLFLRVGVCLFSFSIVNEISVLLLALKLQKQNAYT